MNLLALPYMFIPSSAGAPLENGKVYIGQANLNPETNPIAVYWDAAGTIPAPQPIRTEGGFPSRSGSPAQLYVPDSVAAFSLTVRDRNDVLQYTEPSATAKVTGGFVFASSYGFSTSATAAANAAALQAAINAVAASGFPSTIMIGPGQFNVAADVIAITQPNIDIQGAGFANGYGTPAPATILKFGAGSIGFNLTGGNAPGLAGNYTRLANFMIDGNNVLATGIKVDGQNLLENLTVYRCTNAGYWLFDYINMTFMRNCTAVACTGGNGYGLLIGGVGTTGNNTIFAIKDCTFRSCTIGCYIDNAVHFSFRDTVFESCSAEGLKIFQPTPGRVNYGKFDNCWLENNWFGTSGYNMVVDSTTHDITTGGCEFMTFDNLMFNCSGTTKAMNIVCARWMRFFNTQVGGAPASIDLQANTYNVQFHNTNGGTYTDLGVFNSQRTLDPNSNNGGGVISSTPIIQPSPTSSTFCTPWNPVDLAGTYTKPAARTTIENTTFLQSSFAAGVLTIVLNATGKYEVDVTIGCNDSNNYTAENILVTMGGTAPTNNGTPIKGVAGVPNQSQGGSFKTFVNCTAIGQTVTVAPQGRTTAGAGAVTDHVFYCDVVAKYLGS